MKSRHTVFRRRLSHPIYKFYSNLIFEDVQKRYKPFRFRQDQLVMSCSIGLIHQPKKFWNIIQTWEGELLLTETKYLAQT